MDCERLAAWEELIEKTEDPVDRVDLVSQRERKPQGSRTSPADDSVCGETWRRVLRAHIQPLPAVAD